MVASGIDCFWFVLYAFEIYQSSLPKTDIDRLYGLAIRLGGYDWDSFQIVYVDIA